MELQGKKVLVFGSGKSGIGASDLLAKVGAFPVIYDGNAEIDKEAVVHKTDGTYPVEVYAGELPKEVQESLDLVVLSPGVPTDLPIVKSFYEQGLSVWGEVELAYRVGDGEVLAITGTNGKTTTTALLGKIMQDARESVFVVGNIGTPYTSKALEMKPNSVTVAEISSFQLETIEEFAPKVSAILNITEDHLNRHHTMEEYIRVKELITENQGTEDVCVLNYEDEVLRKFGEHLTPRVVYFSSERKLDEGIYLDGNTIVLKDGEKEIEVVKTEDLKLLGKHNFENVMAAVAMAYYDGVSMDSIRKSICEFTAVAHRIEYVTEKNGVAYYNDSKGTDPDADRLGVYVKDSKTGEYHSLTGNMSGCLIGDYVIGQRKALYGLPEDGAFIRSIVSTNMADAIAKYYGIQLVEVLTGFKFIGQKILEFEKTGKGTYLFGMEESYGCLTGTYARDKDAVDASMTLCEAAAYYKTKNMTLWDAMLAMYERYGYYKDDVTAITLKGIEGLAKIQEIMNTLRENAPAEIGGYKVTAVRDYKKDTITDTATGAVKPTGLPASNVLYYELEDDAWVCVRPSGTEPKVKFYLGVKGTSLEDADAKSKALSEAVHAMIGKML